MEDNIKSQEQDDTSVPQFTSNQRAQGLRITDEKHTTEHADSEDHLETEEEHEVDAQGRSTYIKRKLIGSSGTVYSEKDIPVTDRKRATDNEQPNQTKLRQYQQTQQEARLTGYTR